MLNREASNRTVRNSTQRNRWEGRKGKSWDEVGNNNMKIVAYRVVGCMMMMMMENNYLQYEYAANSATTTINHNML